MPVDRVQLLNERFASLMRMIEENGATAAGEAPPAEHAAALRDTTTLGEADEIANAHAEGRGPPEDN